MAIKPQPDRPLKFHKACFWSSICPRHPGTVGIIRLVSLRSCSHRRLTSPPSLWPGRELRKYHYRCLLSSPDQEQLGIFSRMNRSPRNRGSWRSAAQAIPDSNVVLFPRLPDDWYSVFNVPEKTVSPVSLPEPPGNLSSQGVAGGKAKITSRF